MNNPIYAVVEQNSNRAIAILDEDLTAWWKQNFQSWDVKEIRVIGSSMMTISEKRITAQSIETVDGFTYYIIKTFPEDISLGEAYDLVNKL